MIIGVKSINYIIYNYIIKKSYNIYLGNSYYLLFIYIKGY